MTTVVGPESVRQSSPAAPPPCTAEPERWFDRVHRTHALATCLECPVRRWCAQEALRTRPAWGMWAGVWIDGAFAEASDRLHAVAADTAVNSPGTEKPRATTGYFTERPSAPMSLTPLTLRSAPSVRPGSVAMAVLARSSGHCEIVSDACHFSADFHVSRLPGCPASSVTSAAALYAACRPCAETFGAASVEARQLGYLVDSSAQPDVVPFYWRHARWVLFGRWGQFEETDMNSQTAWAS